MLNDGPRERQLPKVKSRQRSFYSAPGRLWTGHLLLVQPRSSLITPLAALPPVPVVARPLAPISPRFIRARPGPLIPRNWPPVSPRLTPCLQFPVTGATNARNLIGYAADPVHDG